MAAIYRYGDRYSTPSNNTSSNSGVNFKEPSQSQCYHHDERKKYLTAKYGQHEMQLIRKRLAVEDWVDEHLRELYEVDESDTYDCEIDVDELLDIDENRDRRRFIQEKVANAPKSRSQPDVVKKFIEEFLQKAQTL